MKKSNKGFWGNVFELAGQQKRTMKNNAKANGDDQALAIIGVGLGVIGAVAGAIAMPWLYAVNFGVGIVLAGTGLVGGGIAGFATPHIINKVVETIPWGVFKPSNYRAAWEKSKTAKAQTEPKTAKRKKSVTKTSKLDDATSARTALNGVANKNEHEQGTVKSPKTAPKAGVKR